MRARAGDFRADEDDFFAADPMEDFRALDFRAVDFRAVDFRAVDFRAVDLRAVDFRAVDFRALALRAVDFRALELLFRADDFLADVFFRALPRDDEARELEPELRAPPDRLLDPERLVALFERLPLRDFPALRFVLVAMLLLLMKEGVRDLMQNPRAECGSRRRACCIARRARDPSGARGASCRAPSAMLRPVEHR